MRRWTQWAAALTLVLTGMDALPGENPHVSLVPWKLLESGQEIRAPLIVYWIPASRDELRRSELLTSDELTLYSSQCVAMRVVRFDDWTTLDKLGVEGALPVVVLTNAEGEVIARVEGDQGMLLVEDVEDMVRDEIDRRATEAEAVLDEAREKADAGETEAAISLYRSVWDGRCLCPRQGRDAQRALKKLKAK